MNLTNLEYHVMQAIRDLDGKAYGVTIRAAVIPEPSLNGVYKCLDRLWSLNLIEGCKTPPSGFKGGKSKRVFTLSALGASTLEDFETKLKDVLFASGLTVADIKKYSTQSDLERMRFWGLILPG